ncbi:hypothetical protein [Nocardiopsis sp. HUAS JQ3]|uniref:hypothetical protein n=1 Tax=Nocardiopsis sp. HUAS JQ3 TaxID=3061629 RepID=UPI0023A9D0E0|nr:hypothetical protein [Nocardiopsis sp. HUAS JQ3]WDZ93467.1 hypothetical protein PV789_13395 [Nocardiopsis sp. HUAS JQ3]
MRNPLRTAKNQLMRRTGLARPAPGRRPRAGGRTGGRGSDPLAMAQRFARSAARSRGGSPLGRGGSPLGRGGPDPLRGPARRTPPGRRSSPGGQALRWINSLTRRRRPRI